MKNQIIAFLLTLSIVASVVVYFVGPDHFNISLPDWKFEMPDWFSKSDSPKGNEKKSNTKKTSKGNNYKGQVVDSYNGVEVFYNGNVSNVYGRNVAPDGYNLGLKYQCVEFGKRYYYEYFNHKMPDSYGHAKDFYDYGLNDGAFNRTRGLHQYKNGGKYKPKQNDMLVYGPSRFNSFGHLAIVTKVNSSSVDIIQQNPGLNNPNRETIPFSQNNGRWKINDQYIVGWLRKK